VVMNQERLLPADFRSLQPFVDQWAVKGMAERHRRRLNSSAEERRSFYDAMSPGLGAAIDYLNQFSLCDMPPEASTLLQLALSLMEVALTQEVYGAKSEALHSRSARVMQTVKELDAL
jgi:hypothetical protein